MNTISDTAKIRGYIGDGNLKEALQALELCCGALPKTFTNSFHAIQFRHSSLQTKTMKGIILEDEAQVESAQIVDSIFTLLDQIEDHAAKSQLAPIPPINLHATTSTPHEGTGTESQPKDIQPSDTVNFPKWALYGSVAIGLVIAIIIATKPAKTTITDQAATTQGQNVTVKRDTVIREQAQPMQLIEGMVVGKDGRSRAAIEILFGSAKYQAITDSEGKYRIQLPTDSPETVRLYFKRNGVELFQQEILCNQKVLAKLKIPD
jgi:Effector-associated domain 11